MAEYEVVTPIRGLPDGPHKPGDIVDLEFGVAHRLVRFRALRPVPVAAASDASDASGNGDPAPKSRRKSAAGNGNG